MDNIFSYSTDDIFTFEFDTTTQGRIARIDNNVSRLYFVANDGIYTSTEIPTLLQVYDVTTGSIVPAYNEEFLLAWSANYELKHEDVIVLTIECKHHQEIKIRK